jgi:hypothetical protein
MSRDELPPLSLAVAATLTCRQSRLQPIRVRQTRVPRVR